MNQVRKRNAPINENASRQVTPERRGSPRIDIPEDLKSETSAANHEIESSAWLISHTKSALQPTFQKTLNGTLGLLTQSEGFIATFTAGHEPQIEISSHGFNCLAKQKLTWGKTPFKELFANPNQALVISSHDLQASWTELDLPKGDVVLTAANLAGDTTAVIGIYQPHSAGRMSETKIQSLRSQAQLLEQAACSSDLERDVQMQQVRMESMREELSEVQQFFRQFSEAVSQCFWILDTRARQVLLISDNFERVWGSNRLCLNDGLAGFVSTVFPSDRDWVLSQFHLRFGEDLDLEFRIIDEQGELRWIWLRSFASEEAAPQVQSHLTPPIAIDATAAQSFGANLRLVLIADDVTERKQQEERLRGSEALLASRAKMTAVGELASGVAHEINNPLTVIVGRASELARAAEKGQLDPNKVQEMAEKIRSTSLRISQIIASLKSLARKDLGRAVFHPFPLARVVNEMSDLCAEKFKHQGVALEISKIPDALKVEMDPTLISQLVLNLLNNAADAIDKEPTKWVRVDFTENSDSIFLYVTDSGSGIPLKIRSRIFDPFFTTKDPGRGTGLGLSLSANIALHHHGTLHYDHLSSHTRFVLQMPKRNPNGVHAMQERDFVVTGTPGESDQTGSAKKVR